MTSLLITVAPLVTAALTALGAALSIRSSESQLERHLEIFELIRLSQAPEGLDCDVEEVKRRWAELAASIKIPRRRTRRSPIRRLLISVAAHAMPRSARCEWYAAIAEALHDFAPDQQDRVLRSFLLGTPRWVAASWYSRLRRRSAASSPQRLTGDDW